MTTIKHAFYFTHTNAELVKQNHAELATVRIPLPVSDDFVLATIHFASDGPHDTSEPMWPNGSSLV